METIAFIAILAFLLLLAVCGSVAVALLFRKYGDNWEFRRENENTKQNKGDTTHDFE